MASVVESIFNEGKYQNGNFGTLIVLEEAHNYAPRAKGLVLPAITPYRRLPLRD